MALMTGEGVNITEGQAFIAEVTRRLTAIENQAGEAGARTSALEIEISTFKEHPVKAEQSIKEAFARLVDIEEVVNILNMDVITRMIGEKIKTSNETQGEGNARGYNGFSGF